MYIDSIWGAGDNTLTTDLKPLDGTAEEFLSAPAQRPSAEICIRVHKHQHYGCLFIKGGGFPDCGWRGREDGHDASSGAHVCGSLFAMVTGESALLEGPVFEGLSLMEHRCHEPFKTCKLTTAKKGGVLHRRSSGNRITKDLLLAGLPGRNRYYHSGKVIWISILLFANWCTSRMKSFVYI